MTPSQHKQAELIRRLYAQLQQKDKEIQRWKQRALQAESFGCARCNKPTRE